MGNFIIESLIPEMGPNTFWAVPEQGGDPVLVKDKVGRLWKHPRLRKLYKDDRLDLKVGDKIYAYQGQVRTFRGGHKCFLIESWDFVDVAVKFLAENEASYGTAQRIREIRDQEKELRDRKERPWLFLPKNPDWYVVTHGQVGGGWDYVGFFPVKEEALEKANGLLRSKYPEGRIEQFSHKTKPQVVYIAVLEEGDIVPMALRKYERDEKLPKELQDRTGEVIREHCKVSPITRNAVVQYYREKANIRKFWQLIRSLSNQVVTGNDWFYSEPRYCYEQHREKVKKLLETFPTPVTVGNLLSRYAQFLPVDRMVVYELFKYLAREHQKITTKKSKGKHRL